MSSTPRNSRPPTPSTIDSTLLSPPPSSSTSIDCGERPFIAPVSTGVPLTDSDSKSFFRPANLRSTSSRSLSSQKRPKTAKRDSTNSQQTSPEQKQQKKKPKNAMTSLMSIFAYMRIPIASAGALVAGVAGLLYWKQNELIYPRHVPPGSRTEVPKPSDFPDYDNMGEASKSAWEELYIPTPDGETLHGYLMKASNTRSAARNVTIVMFHGNAGNIGHRLPVAGVPDMTVGCNVLMLEYRGYGFSTGTPDEKGINIDAQTGLDWIRQRSDLQNNKLVIYGQSLGGAVAIQLVAKNQNAGDIKGLILENTFLSIRKLIPSAFPPAKYIAHLCHQIWPSESTLPDVTLPILFLSGLQDEIVPASHMQKLYNVSRSPRKAFRTFPKGSHNNTVAAPGYFEAIDEWIREYIVRPIG